MSITQVYNEVVFIVGMNEPRQHLAKCHVGVFVCPTRWPQLKLMRPIRMTLTHRQEMNDRSEFLNIVNERERDPVLGGVSFDGQFLTF